MASQTFQPGNGYQLPPEAYYSQAWFEKEQDQLFVFVNPDGRADPFDEWMGDLDHHLGEFRVDELCELASGTYTFEANWKYYIENHVDWYHLWYTHAKTLSALNHRRGEMIQAGRH